MFSILVHSYMVLCALGLIQHYPHIDQNLDWSSICSCLLEPLNQNPNYFTSTVNYNSLSQFSQIITHELDFLDAVLVQKKKKKKNTALLFIPRREWNLNKTKQKLNNNPNTALFSLHSVNILNSQTVSSWAGRTLPHDSCTKCLAALFLLAVCDRCCAEVWIVRHIRGLRMLLPGADTLRHQLLPNSSFCYV